MACNRCNATGWVCENHPDRPWRGKSSREDSCECGAGAPCPDCGATGGRECSTEAKQMHGVTALLQDIEDALMDEGWEELLTRTKNGVFEWKRDAKSSSSAA